jgi:hypothetical protein
VGSKAITFGSDAGKCPFQSIQGWPRSTRIDAPILSRAMWINDAGASHLCNERNPMIFLGVILMVIGFIAGLSILWVVGVIAVLVGLVLAVSGRAGHQLAGRSHWY